MIFLNVLRGKAVQTACEEVTPLLQNHKLFEKLRFSCPLTSKNHSHGGTLTQGSTEKDLKKQHIALRSQQSLERLWDYGESCYLRMEKTWNMWAQLSLQTKGDKSRRQGAKAQTCILAPNDQPVAPEGSLVKWSLKESTSESEQGL